MSQIINCLRIQPNSEGKAPLFEKHSFTYEEYTSYQTEVGGLFEIVDLPVGDREYIFMVNEEGKLLDLPPALVITYNGQLSDILVGTVLILKGDGEQIVGLDDDDIAYIQKHLVDRIGIRNNETGELLPCLLLNYKN